MKSGIYLGKENIEIRDVDIPQVGDNDVLIKNIYSGICGTDVAVFKHGENTGHKITVGGEFGHETISTVVKVGKNVTDFKIGDRVYPYPLYAKGDTRRQELSADFRNTYLFQMLSATTRFMMLMSEFLTMRQEHFCLRL
jgi:threonine dehydrogenase-like Zn-dependent dehydrogenase